MDLQMGFGSSIASLCLGRQRGSVSFQVGRRWHLSDSPKNGGEGNSWETPFGGLKPWSEGGLGNEGAVPVGNLSGSVSHGHLASSGTSADGIAKACAMPTVAPSETQFSFTWSARRVPQFPAPVVWGAAPGQRSGARTAPCLPVCWLQCVCVVLTATNLQKYGLHSIMWKSIRFCFRSEYKFQTYPLQKVAARYLYLRRENKALYFSCLVFPKLFLKI